MQIKVISTLSNITLVGTSNLTLLNYLLTNKPEDKAPFIDHPDFFFAFGDDTLKNFVSSPCILFNGESVNMQFVKSTDDSTIAETFNKIVYLFISCLWFVKDNAVNGNFCYLINETSGTYISNTSNKLISNAQGEYRHTLFSENELKQGLSIFYKLLILLQYYPKSDETKSAPLQVNSEPTPIASPYNRIPYNTHTRLQRAINFLSKARNESFLPARISFLIAILESLFTTYTTNVSQQIQKRIALFIKNSLDEATMQTLKKAYSIRSKFFHGQILIEVKMERSFADRPKLITVSIGLEDILRQVLIKALNEPEFLKPEKEVKLWINKSFPINLKKMKKISGYINVYTHEVCEASFASNTVPFYCPNCGGSVELEN